MEHCAAAFERFLPRFDREHFNGHNNQDSIVVLDTHGNELWHHSVFQGEMGYALHPQGIVYILQADYANNSLFTLFAKDEQTEGLGRLQDPNAIPLIIRTCERLPTSEFKVPAAYGLLMFHDAVAQAAADKYITDKRYLAALRQQVAKGLQGPNMFFPW